MSRAARRSWDRRELKRATDEKTGRFFQLYREGFSKVAIASKLNMDLPTVEKMFAATGEHDHSEEETVMVGGGG